MNKELSNALTKLMKNYKQALPDVGEAGVTKRLTLSSPQLNFIFGGGFPLGRIVEFFGPESGGKTVISSYIGGQFQKRNDGGPNTVLFIDMEHAFDKHYAEVAGLDCSDDKLIFVRPLNGEEAFTICQGLIETGQIGLIVWDSVASTPTLAAMTDEYGKASFGGTAKLFSEGLRKLNPYLSRYGTSLILLNQVRDQIGGFAMPGMKPESTPGGRAVKFYASWRGRVSKMEDIADKKEVIGNTIKIRNAKSKVGFPKRIAQLELYYGTGFNPDQEYVDFIIKLGLVKQGGAWLSNEEWGMKVQGRDKLLDWLKANPERFAECKEIVTASFTSNTVLDTMDDDSEPLDEEDDSEVSEE